MKKIVFFIQTKKPIGGSQIQFLDMATHISKNYSEYDVYYINHPNKTVEEMYGGSGVHFCDVSNCDYSFFKDAVFFTPVNYLFYLMDKIQNLDGPKICLYFYHPQIMEWLNTQFESKTVDYLPLLKLLSKTNGYCFMDKSNYLSIRRNFSVDFEKRYVPVPITTGECVVKTNPVCHNPFSIGWLGRLDGDKIQSVVNLLDNLLDIGGNYVVHLIGDGNAKNKINLKKYGDNIKIVCTSYLYGDTRDMYIANNVDLAISMGISALNCSLVGVPTAIPLVSEERICNDRYTLVYDTCEYSLGWNPKDCDEMGCKVYSLGDLIEYFSLNKNKVDCGIRCRDYALSTFSIDRCVNNFLDVVSTTKLTVKDCRKLSIVSNRLLIYKLFKFITKDLCYESFHEFSAKTKREILKKGYVRGICSIFFNLVSIRRGKLA